MVIHERVVQERVNSADQGFSTLHTPKIGLSSGLALEQGWRQPLSPRAILLIGVFFHALDHTVSV